MAGTQPLVPNFTLPMPEYDQSPEDFATNADRTVQQWPTVIAKQNELADWTAEIAGEIAADKASTEASAALAAMAATAAASAANYAGLWADLTGSLDAPASVGHLGTVWLLNDDIADITASEPSSVNADYQQLNGVANGALIVASETITVDVISNVQATSLAVDLTLPTTEAGNTLAVHNSVDSTQTVTILNTIHTIKRSTGTIAIDDNLVVLPGQTITFIANNGTALEVLSEESSPLTYPMTALIEKTSDDEDSSDNIAITLDCTANMFWRFDFGQSPLVTASGSVDFTITGLPTDPTIGFTGHVYMLGQGRKDISFAAAGWTTEWDGGVAPELGAAATDKDTIIFYLEPDTSTIVLSVMRGKHA